MSVGCVTERRNAPQQPKTVRYAVVRVSEALATKERQRLPLGEDRTLLLLLRNE